MKQELKKKDERVISVEQSPVFARFKKILEEACARTNTVQVENKLSGNRLSSR